MKLLPLKSGIRVENDEFRFSRNATPQLLIGDQWVRRSWSSQRHSYPKAEDARKHLRGSVKKVIISAPAKNEDITIVLELMRRSITGRNTHYLERIMYDNCLAPVAKVIHREVWHPLGANDHHPLIYQRSAFTRSAA